MPQYVCGIDPGTVNLAATFIDVQTGDCTTMAFDLSMYRQSSKKFELSAGYLGAVCIQLVIDLKEYFKSTLRIGVECMYHPDANKDVIKLSCMLQQTIRVMHPGIFIHDVNPRTLRCAYNYSGGDYRTRKKSGIDVTREYIGSTNHRSMCEVFKNKSDCHDSFMIALFSLLNTKESHYVYKFKDPSNRDIRGGLIKFTYQIKNEMVLAKLHSPKNAIFVDCEEIPAQKKSFVEERKPDSQRGKKRKASQPTIIDLLSDEPIIKTKSRKRCKS